MKLLKLQERSRNKKFPKTLKIFQKFEVLLDELSEKHLDTETINFINAQVEDLNHSLAKQKKYHDDLSQAYKQVLNYLRKHEKIVPKNYYRNMWIALGISAFGVPIGVAFGLILDNMAFLGIGLPIGMSIGLAVGSGMDQSAKKNGKQLELDIHS